jgi:acetyl-CoA/propionyl-CoA carboxylase, biotin carboxylase, biotin carboxyl carrier protein
MKDTRLRVSVGGPAALVIQPAPDEVAGFAPARAGELIVELPTPADERSLGLRRFEVVVDGWRFEVTLEAARRAELREKAARAGEAQQQHVEVALRAQIPGRVVRLWVTDGEQVEAGQRLLAVEAMKMENEIRAPHGGTVRGLRVAIGQTVERGDELLSIG